jgi:acetyl-CoA carboxylase carboxyl transferase subunit alpha
VITQEGCSAILWKDSGRTAEAASSLKITAADLLSLGVIDEIVPEPAGGAHEDWDRAAELLKAALLSALGRVESQTDAERRAGRYQKFRQMGRFE